MFCIHVLLCFLCPLLKINAHLLIRDPENAYSTVTGPLLTSFSQSYLTTEPFGYIPMKTSWKKCSVEHQLKCAFLSFSCKHEWLISFSSFLQVFKLSRWPSWYTLSFLHYISFLYYLFPIKTPCNSGVKRLAFWLSQQKDNPILKKPLSLAFLYSWQ